MNIPDRDIQAYVDGELAPDEAARIVAAIGADATVAARVERERRLRARVRGAYAGVLAEPVPASLRALLAKHDTPARPRLRGVTACTVAEPSPRRPIRAARWYVPAALAASVAMLAASIWLQLGVPLQLRDGVMVARGALARDLDTALAGALRPKASTMIGLTFRDVDGRICRSFSNAEAALAGLACRDGDRWTLQVVSQLGDETGDEVRQASSATPAAVLAAVDARLQGEVFDAAQERAARQAGWR